MSTIEIDPPSRGSYRRSDARLGWFAKAEGWLDDHGKGAWIGVTVLSLIFIWPVGLLLLAYMIWSKRMFSRTKARYDANSAYRTARTAMRSSGNAAFDAYKADTLRRLEEEQADFEAFLERLREAKDKAEFDQFMDDRAKDASQDRERDYPPQSFDAPRGSEQRPGSVGH